MCFSMFVRANTPKLMQLLGYGFESSEIEEISGAFL